MDNAHHPLTHFFERLDAQSHSFQQLLPPTSMVQQFAQEIFDFLFPIHCEQPRRASVKYAILGDELTRLLEPLDVEAAPTADAFFHNLPALHEKLLADAEATMAFDPAATSLQEVIITYPGFYAITIYRIAHELVKLGVPLLPLAIFSFWFLGIVFTALAARALRRQEAGAAEPDPEPESDGGPPHQRDAETG